MLEKLKAMFQPGPKERTTAAYLAMFAGWAGLHKFYLGYKDVGIIHAALTGLGAFVILVQLAGPPGATAVVLVAAILALLGGYFYVGRAYFGLSVAEILSPGRIFLFPWRLVSYVFRLVRVGSNIMDEEEEERRMRRAWRRGGWGGRRGRRGRRGRGRYDDDDDDDDGCGLGCWVMVLGIVLTLVVIAAIVVLFIILAMLVGFIAVGLSIALGVAEGIRYLGKSDEEFQHEYVINQKPWF